MPVQCTCHTCGSTFFVPPSHIKYGKGIHCSRACYFARRIPVAQRFWSKVDKNGPIASHAPGLGQCWIWTGSTSEGYGQINVGGGDGRHDWAHRVSWEIHHGPIPDGLWVLHRCDNPSCVRPDHLFLGTVADNNRDMIAKGRHRSPSGHRQSSSM